VGGCRVPGDSVGGCRSFAEGRGGLGIRAPRVAGHTPDEALSLFGGEVLGVWEHLHHSRPLASGRVTVRAARGNGRRVRGRPPAR
jgi:hypothetical protein